MNQIGSALFVQPLGLSGLVVPAPNGPVAGNHDHRRPEGQRVNTNWPTAPTAPHQLADQP